MKHLALLLCLCSSAHCATIIGDIRTTAGVGINTKNIVFEPTLTPLADGTITYLDYTSTARAYSGKFTNICAGGNYDVHFDGSKIIKIMVPTNSPATYDFNYVAQLATNVPAFSFTSVLGLISSYINKGTNIFFVTNNLGVLGESITISGVTDIFQVYPTANFLTNWARVNTNRPGTCIDRGIATMVSGVATVRTIWAYTTNIIQVTRYSAAEQTNVFHTIGAITNGVSFNINSNSSTDSASSMWAIFLP